MGCWCYFVNKILTQILFCAPKLFLNIDNAEQNHRADDILHYYLNCDRTVPIFKGMKSSEWPRRHKSTLSWQHLSGHDNDTGERWTVIWDTKRKPGTDGRNSAAERYESTALDRARHMLRLGFVVYEIRQPSGLVFLEEAGILDRLGLRPAITGAAIST